MQFFPAPMPHWVAMFGRPPRRQLGPRYDFWASLVAFACAGALLIAVIIWALNIVPD